MCGIKYLTLDILNNLSHYIAITIFYKIPPENDFKKLQLVFISQWSWAIDFLFELAP